MGYFHFFFHYKTEKKTKIYIRVDSPYNGI